MTDAARGARATLVAGTLLVAASSAGAQTPTDTLRADTTRADSVRAASPRARQPLPPVVTTVLRTPLPLARAPFAVSVNGRADVQGARPGLAADEALRLVPGVQVDNRFNAALGERISIRGFGARTQFGVRGVKVLVDGIPATMPDGQTTLNHVELGTLGRAEVVRGPASALYGNAAGGVIQLETEPAPDAPIGARVRALAGSDGLSRVQGVAGGRGDAGDWLLSVGRLGYDGFRQWSDQRSTRATARGTLRTRAGAVRASAAWVDYDARNPGSLTDSLLRVAPERAFANNVRQQTGERGRHAQLGSAWQGALPGGEGEASAFVLQRHVDNPIPVTIVGLDRTAGGVRAAYTAVAGPRDESRPQAALLRLTVGGEAQRQRDDRRNWANAQGVRGATSLDQLERVTTRAAFAQASLALGARTTVLGGVRHDRVRFAARDRLITATNPDDSGERLMRATTPTLGVSVAVAPWLALAANTSASFETPTTTELANRPNGAGGLNPDLEPQRARGVEVGVSGARTLGAGVAATWQLAAYRTRITQALIPFEVPNAPGRQFYRNAGSAVHRGVEAALGATFAHGIEARTAYTLVDARFERYAVGTNTFDDHRVPGVAPQRLDAALAWRGRAGAFVELETRAQSWQPATDANDARAAGFTIATVRGAAPTLRLAGATLAPFAGVTNLFDRRWITAVTVNAAGRRYFEPGQGRSFYLGADVGALGGRR